MAPGIRNLVEAVKDLGKVVVVAPDKPQSGMGHAITIGLPLRSASRNHFRRGGSLSMFRNAGRLCKTGRGQGAAPQTGYLPERDQSWSQSFHQCYLFRYHVSRSGSRHRKYTFCRIFPAGSQRRGRFYRCKTICATGCSTNAFLPTSINIRC